MKFSKCEHRMSEALYRVGIYHVRGADLTALAARANDGRLFGASIADYERVARAYLQDEETRPVCSMANSPYDDAHGTYRKVSR